MCIYWNILLCQTNDREDKDIMKSETPSGKTYSKKVQHLLFPDTNYCTERDMFFRLGNNTHHSDNSIIFDESHTTVWFNTYFNSFSIGKWAKFANIRGVSLTLRLKGKFIVTIIREEDIMGNRTSDMIAEQTLSCDTQKEFNISLNSVHTTGIYFFILHAIEANSVYYGGYYSVLPSAEPKHIKLGISICHFKKEPYIRTNMAAITRYLKDFPELKNKIEVFISDNGNTLTKSDAPYDFVNIFPNKNVGGAGGFTRCIMEIQKANSAGNNITHALLMDDDLTFNPEIFYRTQALLSLLKPKYNRYFFSGTMNRLDRKNIQHENGALWNGGNFVSLKPNFDMNDFGSVLFNDCVEESVEFAPWWYCAIPVEVTQNNLPLPIFYREDDSEYGMRSADGIISINGICVWHEPFENKFVPFVCYYHSRNMHIVNALHHPEYGKKFLLDYTLREIRRELYFMRYHIADLYLKAAEDFLKGISWLKNTDTALLHKEVMETGYKMTDVGEIKEMPFIYGEYATMYNRPPLSGWKLKIWNHSCCGHLIKGVRDVWVPIAPGKVRTEMFVKAKRAFHYDQNSNKGFVTVRSFKEYRRVMKRYSRLKKLVNKKYNHIAKEYRERLTEITSAEFWKKYLGV